MEAPKFYRRMSTQRGSLRKAQGLSLREIARRLGVSRNTVARHLKSEQVPRYKPREARPTKLEPFHEYILERMKAAAEERESISRGLASGASYRAIGRQLGRSASTISREVGRNGGPGKYRAYDAEKRFLKRGLRPKPYLLSSEPELRGIVIRLLEADWSPEQISGWLKHHSPDGKIMCVSHETIYRSLFVQARGVLREELKKAPTDSANVPPCQTPSGGHFRRHSRLHLNSFSSCGDRRPRIARALGRRSYFGSKSERHCHDRRQKHAVHPALQDRRQAGRNRHSSPC